MSIGVITSMFVLFILFWFLFFGFSFLVYFITTTCLCVNYALRILLEKDFQFFHFFCIFHSGPLTSPNILCLPTFFIPTFFIPTFFIPTFFIPTFFHSNLFHSNLFSFQPSMYQIRSEKVGVRKWWVGLSEKCKKSEKIESLFQQKFGEHNWKSILIVTSNRNNV